MPLQLPVVVPHIQYIAENTKGTKEKSLFSKVSVMRNNSNRVEPLLNFAYFFHGTESNMRPKCLFSRAYPGILNRPVCNRVFRNRPIRDIILINWNAT